MGHNNRHFTASAAVMEQCTAPVTPGARWSFVSIRHPSEMKNRQNQLKVHQHAMKEIGLRRRKKQASGHEARAKMNIAQAMPLGKNEMTATYPTDTEKTARSITRAVPSPGSDAVLHLPPRMRAQKMKDFLFRRNSAFCLKVRELCFSLALFDDGAYCLALAEAALYGKKPSHYLLPHQENAVSLRYYHQSVNQVNQHIQSVATLTKAASHGIAGAVLGLASYDVSVGNMQRWNTHMAGLEALINSRDSLQAHSSVFFMLSLLWTDTTGSLVLDQTPRFSIPIDIMQPYRKPVERPLLAQNLARLRSLDPQLEDIASILELLTGLTETFDMKDRGDSENYTVHCITRARVSYLLLHVPRGDPQTILDVSANTSSVLRETIRLTGLVFLLVLVGFVPCGGPGPISTVSKHAARLCKLLKCHDRRWMGMSELQLWVFVVTAVATVDSHHRTWLASRVVVLMGEVGVSWGGLAGTLKQLAWVDGVLDGRLREIAALAQETAA